jgi:hypothetical protein
MPLRVHMFQVDLFHVDLFQVHISCLSIRGDSTTVSYEAHGVCARLPLELGANYSWSVNLVRVVT